MLTHSDLTLLSGKPRIGFIRTIARLKKCYPGKFWKFKNVKLKKYPDLPLGETVINLKGLGELRLHQNRTIWGEEWWAGGSSLLSMGSVSLLQHSGKTNLFLFLFPCLISFVALSNFTQFIPKQVYFKLGLPHRIFFTIEKSSVSKKMLSEKSHSNWIIKACIAMNLLFLADDLVRTLSFVGKFCFWSRGGHNCRQLRPSMSDSPESVSQFLMFVAKKKWKMKSKLNSLKYSFGLLIHTIVLAHVTPILANSGTWCSEQLLLFQRNEKIKSTEEKNLLFWYT